MCVICQHCGNPAKLVTGKVMYPHRMDLAHKRFWACKPCGAYVGCHPNTETPMGTLATKEVRQARNAAHFAFDDVWRGKRSVMSRQNAYAWLAERMGLTVDQAHIGMFDAAQCAMVMDLVEELRRKAA